MKLVFATRNAGKVRELEALATGLEVVSLAAFPGLPEVEETEDTLEGNARLKALAVTTARRSALAPELPTHSETGLPGFDIYTWWGFMAPAGTAKEIVAKWNAEVTRILNTPEMKAFFAQQGAEPAPTTPEQFAALIRSEIPKYAKIVKDSGAKVD